MTDYDTARTIEGRILSIVSARASDLTPVREIERDTPQDAVHKLQVQVLALTDALSAVITEVDRLRRER